MRFLYKTSRIFLAGILPADPTKFDIISKDTNTYAKFIQKPLSKETGWDRIQDIYKVDEFGNISPELNAVHQAGFLGFFVGVLYGGFINSRVAYINFIENNEATAFTSHLEAKKKLQNDFTISFAKGGFKWGWRIALFTTSYYGIITLISVYRGKSSIYEYLAAGSITGSVYKINMGLRGMVAGSIIGMFIGGIAGLSSLLLLKLSGTSMEEIRYWQYKWRLNREDQIREALKSQVEEPEISVKHDEKIKTNKFSLDNI